MRKTSNLLVRGIPRELHQRLRVLAAQSGRTIREVVIDLLETIPKEGA